MGSWARHPYAPLATRRRREILVVRLLAAGLGTLRHPRQPGGNGKSWSSGVILLKASNIPTFDRRSLFGENKFVNLFVVNSFLLQPSVLDRIQWRTNIQFLTFIAHHFFVARQKLSGKVSVQSMWSTLQPTSSFTRHCSVAFAVSE